MMAGALHGRMRCHILGVAYTVKDRRGRPYTDMNESVDETQVIKFFQSIDPDVERIETYHEATLVSVLTMGESHWEIYHAN